VDVYVKILASDLLAWLGKGYSPGLQISIGLMLVSILEQLIFYDHALIIILRILTVEVTYL
jgi:hypothetical protein